MGKLCPFYEEGKCNLLEDEAAECNFDCDMYDFARTLYSADYRKVIHCKDCVFCEVVSPVKMIEKKAEEMWYCRFLRLFTKPDVFCSFAKMKGESKDA